MKGSRYISLFLAVLMLITCLTFPLETAAAGRDSLNVIQEYYLRTVGSLARADYYENNILASVTVSQAIYEAGWAMYSLPIGGRNLFGIKAYNTWDGMVYDQNENILYSSYEDFLLTKGQSYLNTVSAWRAHESWAESVAAHSSLFLTESKYAAVVGETDYKKMAKAIVAAGYCSDNGYANKVAEFIETYDLTEFDDLTPDSDGIVALTASDEQVRLNIGDTYSLSVNYYPADKTPSKITWKSDNPDVATVSKKGKITAVAHGTTLITATLANGREACCIVYVDCNATVRDSDVYIRTSPDASSDNVGKFSRGAAIKVVSDKLYTDSEGNSFYKVKGYNKKGELVSGYSSADYIYFNICDVTDISVVKNEITLKKGWEYTVKTAVSPANASDKTLKWKSSDESIVTVDENGTIKAVGVGMATVTASASSGVTEKILVNVAADAAKYTAVVSASSSNIRKEPSDDSERLGSFSFLSEITVIGEPVNGVWYKASGKTSSGKSITGYVYAPYIRLVDEDFNVTYPTASDGISVYEKANNSSRCYGTLRTSEQYAIIDETSSGWSLVVGKTASGSTVYGYANTKNSGTQSNNNNNGGTTVDSGINLTASGFYGRTKTRLNVRSGAGSSYSVLGIFAADADIVISYETDGWYAVSGKDENGKDVSGFASASRIETLYSAVTTSNLNVRKEPTTEADSVGVFANNQKITVIGEKDANGWYAVEGTDREGNWVSGYSFGDHITIEGKLEAELSVDGFTLLDANLIVKNSVLNGLSPKTTVADLKKAFKNEITVLDASGKELSDESLVGTGCNVRSEESGSFISVLLLGDVDGDGDVTSYDYVFVKRHFFQTYLLEGLYLKAAKVSGDKDVGIIDYVMIKRVVFGTYKF